MFLFKRKKEDNDAKAAEPTKAELLRPDKSKKGNPEQVKGKTIDAESVVETFEKPVAQDSPIKVVVPASALKEEAEESIPVAVVPPVASLPDEVVDSLLTPGHQAAATPSETKAAVVLPPAPVAAKAADPPPMSPKPDNRKAVKEGEGKENMFSSIFGKAIEEEENSLGRLIKALPEISMEEVLNEADEVKNLIREFS